MNTNNQTSPATKSRINEQGYFHDTAGAYRSVVGLLDWVITSAPSSLAAAAMVYGLLTVFGSHQVNCVTTTRDQQESTQIIQRVSYQCGITNPLHVDHTHLDRIARPCTASIDGGSTLPASLSGGMISIMNDASTQINLRTGEFVSTNLENSYRPHEMTGHCKVA